MTEHSEELVLDAATANVRDGRPRVLVLGGGFAGIGAARALKGADVEVVLVDRRDYHTFQPLLYQLATGLLDHLAPLPTNEDRAKAVVDWAGTVLTHQRTGRITVETDEPGKARRAE